MSQILNHSGLLWFQFFHDLLQDEWNCPEISKSPFNVATTALRYVTVTDSPKTTWPLASDVTESNIFDVIYSSYSALTERASFLTWLWFFFFFFWQSEMLTIPDLQDTILNRLDLSVFASSVGGSLGWKVQVSCVFPPPRLSPVAPILCVHWSTDTPTGKLLIWIM